MRNLKRRRKYFEGKEVRGSCWTEMLLEDPGPMRRGGMGCDDRVQVGDRKSLASPPSPLVLPVCWIALHILLGRSKSVMTRARIFFLKQATLTIYHRGIKTLPISLPRRNRVTIPRR